MASGLKSKLPELQKPVSWGGGFLSMRGVDVKQLPTRIPRVPADPPEILGVRTNTIQRSTRPHPAIKQ